MTNLVASFDIEDVKVNELELEYISRDIGCRDFVLYYERGYDSDKEINLGFEAQYDDGKFNGVVSYCTNIGEDYEEWERLKEGELYNHIVKLAEIDYHTHNNLFDVQRFLYDLKSKKLKASVIHAYVFHYEAENANEVDVYFVNIKVCYSFDEQETFCDGITFESLEACQKHISYIESQFIKSGYEDMLLVDIEPN